MYGTSCLKILMEEDRTLRHTLWICVAFRFLLLARKPAWCLIRSAEQERRY